MANVKDHLQNTFEDLGADNFKRFLSKLGDRKEEPRVRKATVEKIKDALDLTDLMVGTFTTRDALPVTLEILKAIGCHQLAQELSENTGHAPTDAARPPSAGEIIDKHWATLIKRVNNVDPILDVLLQKGVITNGDYRTFLAMPTPEKKMRELLIGPINAAGAAGKEILYKALKENEVYLMQELESDLRN
ncbi:hypothetical protein DNTS_021157 [Danionella cerebrum]|uniref:Pyrin domain-containing protein n=1 Tax=Danionella cerebrum TaxID=2873325 RepID=A0A553R1H9_9TELE|nr:hypothetical protein DNTS_021157 [Danionella translucida]